AQDIEKPFFTGEICSYVSVECGQGNLIVETCTGLSDPPIRIMRCEPEGEKLAAADLRCTLGRWMAREIGRLLTTEGALHVGLPEALQRLSAGQIFILTSTGREGVEAARYLRELGLVHAFYTQEGLIQTDEGG